MQTERLYIEEYMGYPARDRVTGFEGVVTSISFDLFGCVQCALTPPATKDERGKQEHGPCNWYDANRLQLTGDRVMPLTDFPFVTPAGTPSKVRNNYTGASNEKPAPR